MSIFDLKITLGQVGIIILLGIGVWLAISAMKRLLKPLKPVGFMYYGGAAVAMVIVLGAAISFPLSHLASAITANQNESERWDKINQSERWNLINKKDSITFNSSDTLLIPSSGYAVLAFHKDIEFIDSDSYGISYKVGLSHKTKVPNRFVTFTGGVNNLKPKFSNISISLGDTTIQVTTNLIEQKGWVGYKFVD